MSALDWSLKVWESNRIDRERDIPAEEVLRGWLAFVVDERARLEYYGTERMLLEFLAIPEGINAAIALPGAVERGDIPEPASCTQAQWDELVEAARQHVYEASS